MAFVVDAARRWRLEMKELRQGAFDGSVVEPQTVGKGKLPPDG